MTDPGRHERPGRTGATQEAGNLESSVPVNTGPRPLAELMPGFVAGADAASAGRPPEGWSDWPLVRSLDGGRRG